MAFWKNYPNRKDWRKKYRGSKAFDSSCGNHGSCPWCESNRLLKYILLDLKSEEEIKEYYEEKSQERIG